MYILGVVGPGQVMIIALVIVVLFFGGKKIPELMKGLGQGVKEFKDASKGDNIPLQQLTIKCLLTLLVCLSRVKILLFLVLLIVCFLILIQHAHQ